MMRIINRRKIDFKKAMFGLFLAVMSILGTSYTLLDSQPTYAVPAENETTETTESPETTETTTSNSTTTNANSEKDNKDSTSDTCKSSLGAIGWLVCPTTGKISEAVDWLYDKIEDILVINPVPAKDGSPIYEIWKYCRGLTNIVFIIFLLIVIYSQITGMGISNYGIKKALPKLIIAAVLVNLSFLICSLAVDVSNVVGNSLRGVFSKIAESAVVVDATTTNGDLSAQTKMSYAGMYSSLAGGTALAIGAGTIAFEAGAIWMLIPTVLGALVAVASGLITIALRQAVVALLIMISPLAMVTFILPNTEQWFKKWKDLLIKMLIFYPMFSLLFGASNLAGFAIIVSSSSGFGVLLGMAVQIFPLFFAWSLMKMSGTFLGTINSKINGFAARPLATNRAWADSHRQLSKQKHLASGRATTPSLRLMQFVSNRRMAREEDISEMNKLNQERGRAYRASRNWRRAGANGLPTRRGEEAYERMSRSLEYQQIINRDQNTMNKGLGYLAKEGTADKVRLDKLDAKMISSVVSLKTEQARGEKIEYENTKGYHNMMNDAINSHFDQINRNKKGYRMHDIYDRVAAENNYSKMQEIMEGNVQDVQYAAATAAQSYDTQKKIVESKMQKYFEFTPPTKDVVYRLEEFAKNKDAIANIDSVIAGLRILNQRGDTDLVRQQMNNILDQGLDLGTYASQSLASFLMFEVKDNDPWLRRFGKYINLETANVFNGNKRQEMKITYDEYIKGYHQEPDGSIMYAKRPMAVLMEGTPLDNIERTALSNFDDSLKEAYSYTTPDNKKHLNVAKYLEKREEIQNAIGPQFISASLKYVSGSEQLKSAVSFLTGYTYSQMKDSNNNTVVDKDGNVLYEWKARWDKGGDLTDDPEAAKKYFQEKSMQYFKDQTPSQILSLRSDYRDPLMSHLVSEYLSDKPDEKREYDAEVARIQNSYGDEANPVVAREKREKDINKLNMELAGRQVRKILGETGKLEQIYRTRRSGAANNAKDWVRKWLNLDDEVAVNNYLERSRNERKKQMEESKRAGGESTYDDPDVGRVYKSSDRATFVTGIDDLWTDLRDEDDETFFNESLEKVNEWLGKGSYIAKAYEDFYKDTPSADSHEMREQLKELLSDPENYPDA